MTLRAWSSSCGRVDVIVEESTVGFCGTGLKVWSAAEYLSELICMCPALVHGRRVLELGAGCGLVSAVAASLGGNVTATDQSMILPRLRRTSSLGTQAQRFDVTELDWSIDLPPWPPGHFDIIVGSDITYGFNSQHTLLPLLWKLSNNHSTACLLAHTARSPEQAALLWHSICEVWPGVAWVHDGFDALVDCHNFDGDQDAELTSRVICFALCAAIPSDSSALFGSYVAFAKASHEQPLQLPEPTREFVEAGMIGPQRP